MKRYLKIAVIAVFVMLVLGTHAQVKIFDGKTLEGWKCEPTECLTDWKAEKNMLVGENVKQSGSIIWTSKSYKDFEFEVEYKALTKDYDTGVFLRGESHQVQIGISRSLKKDMTACIYAPKDERGKYPGESGNVAKYHKIGDWNTLKVIASGKRIQTFLNGEPLVDYTGVVIPMEGPVGLQLHSGVHMKVQFKNVKIKEL